MTDPLRRTNDEGGININCRQASILLSKREDMPLGRMDRLKLSIHLAICKYCRNVARQFASIRLAMRKLRDSD